MSDTPGETLADKIQDALVVDEPDEKELVDALAGAIEITDGSWTLNVNDAIEAREPKDQVFTYLLGKYAAARVSDGEAPMAAKRDELYRHFDRKLVKVVCEHGWVKHWDGYVQIRPDLYQHTATELSVRYGNQGDSDE